MDYFLAGMIALVLVALGVGIAQWWREEPRLRRRELPDVPDHDAVQTLLEVATYHSGLDVGSGHDGGSGFDASNDGGGDGGGGDGGGGGD